MMLGNMLAGFRDDTKASEIIFSLGDLPLSSAYDANRPRPSSRFSSA
jgi:hypothetical protein